MTGRWQTRLRQTYAAGAAVDQVAVGHQRDRARPRLGGDDHRAERRVPPGRSLERVALLPRRPDDGHLDRSVERSLGRGERPAGEAGRGVGDAAGDQERPLGGVAVAARSGEGGVRQQRVDDRRVAARAGVVGRVARADHQRLGVVGGVVEAAVVGGEVLEHGVEQLPGALQPGAVAGRAGEREEAGRRRSRSPRARRRASPATPSRETRSSRPSRRCTSARNSPHRTAASTRSGAPSSVPASTSPLIARPFQAATTLSSRAGRTRVDRASSSRDAHRLPALRVVGLGLQLERGGALLEGALVGDREQRRRPRAVLGAEHLGQLGRGPDVEGALLALGVRVERGGEGALVGAELGEHEVARCRARPAPACASSCCAAQRA